MVRKPLCTEDSKEESTCELCTADAVQAAELTASPDPELSARHWAASWSHFCPGSNDMNGGKWSCCNRVRTCSCRFFQEWKRSIAHDKDRTRSYELRTSDAKEAKSKQYSEYWKACSCKMEKRDPHPTGQWHRYCMDGGSPGFRFDVKTHLPFSGPCSQKQYSVVSRLPNQQRCAM